MRIVAGKFKGLKLTTFDEDNVRPTLDKVREAIFSKIQFDIKGAKFLDLFGGTGAVSLEAVSRGADMVCTVDVDNRSVKIIKENFAKAKAVPNLLVMNYLDAIQKLNVLNKKFDFIFLDPPFKTNYGPLAILEIIKTNILAEDGMIIYEHLKEDKPFDLSQGYEIVDNKNYGTVQVTYIKRVSAE